MPDATNSVCMSVFGARFFFGRDAVIAGAALFLGNNEHHQMLIGIDQELLLQAIALTCPAQSNRRVGTDDKLVHAPPPWTVLRARPARGPIRSVRNPFTSGWREK